MTTCLVYWVDAFGASHSTRIVTAHIAAFIADVAESGGTWREIHAED